MTLFIECLIACLLFTLVIALMMKNPLNMIHDYPPAIQDKVRELGLITDEQKGYSKTDIIRKIFAIIVFGLLLALLVHKANGAETFAQGFLYSYIIWNAVDWWDAFVIDILWFCHSDKVKIPGTEDMKEYKDYLFHIKGSFKGMLFGLPACLIVGLMVLLF